MGYYFNIQTKTLHLKEDLPHDEVDWLNYYINDWPKVPLPAHQLFHMQRGTNLFSPHADLPKPVFSKIAHGYILSIAAEINYGYEEIHGFVEWLTPRLKGRKIKEYIGFYKGESWECPRINLYVERISSNKPNEKLHDDRGGKEVGPGN